MTTGNLDMDVHITKTCSSAFYYLYNIRHIRKYLSRSSSETLIHAFITSRLDYCNSLLYGLPKYQLSKLLLLVWFIVLRSRATSRLYFVSYIGWLFVIVSNIK